MGDDSFGFSQDRLHGADASGVGEEGGGRQRQASWRSDRYGREAEGLGAREPRTTTNVPQQCASPRTRNGNGGHTSRLSPFDRQEMNQPHSRWRDIALTVAPAAIYAVETAPGASASKAALPHRNVTEDP